MSNDSLQNLPWLQFDELIYCWVGHVATRNPGRNKNFAVSRQLFGGAYAGFSPQFTCNLQNLRDVVGDAIGSVEDLAIHHTLAGYFLIAHQPETSERLLKLQAGDYSTSFRNKFGISPNSAFFLPIVLKGCISCIEFDLSEYGRAWWHVEHQFPSCFTCRAHGTVLFEIAIPPWSKRWILPSRKLAEEHPGSDLSPAQIRVLQKLTEFSVAWFEMGPSALTFRGAVEAIRAGLDGHGWLTAGGRIRFNAVFSALRNYYEGLECLPFFAALLDSATCSYSSISGYMRSHDGCDRRAHLPQIYLVLIALLFDSWGEFCDAYAHPSEQLTTTPSIDHLSNSANPLREQVVQLAKEGLTVFATAKSLGLSWVTVARIYAAEGFPPKFKRSKKFTEQMARQAEQLLRSGMATTVVAMQLGLSRATVDKLIWQNPTLASENRLAMKIRLRDQHRAEFLKIRAANPNVPIYALRRLDGPRPAEWLFKNDREWIAEQRR